MKFFKFCSLKLREQKKYAYLVAREDRINFAKERAKSIRKFMGMDEAKRDTRLSKKVRASYFTYNDGFPEEEHFGSTIPLAQWKKYFDKRKKRYQHKPRFLKKLPIPVKGSGKPLASASYLGRYPMSTRNLPSYIDLPNVAFEICDRLGIINRDPRTSERVIKNGLMARGGFTSTLPHLVKMATHSPRRKGYKHLFDVFNYVDELDLPSLEDPGADDVDFCSYNPDSLNGGDFAPFGSKGSNLDETLTAAKIHGRLIRLTPTPDISVYTLGAREKRNFDLKNGDVISGRAVINQDSVESCVAKPYTRGFEKHFKKLNKDSPIFIGNKMQHMGWLRLCNRLNDSVVSTANDVSGFDNSTFMWLFCMAFSILRMSYPPSKQIDNAFYHFCYGMAFKRIVTPDGLLYLFEEGFPSGSAWTSIVGTIINWIILRYTFNVHMRELGYDPDVVKFTLYGDDFIAHFSKEVSFSNDRIKEILEKDLGYKLKDQDYVGKGFSSDPTKNISFLKVAFDERGMPHTRHRDVIEKVALPTKAVNSAAQFFQYFFSQTVNCIHLPESVRTLATILATHETGDLEAVCDPVKYRKRYERFKYFFDVWKSVIDEMYQKLFFTFEERNESSASVSRKGLYNKYNPLVSEREVYTKDYHNKLAMNWIHDNTLQKQVKVFIPFSIRRDYLVASCGGHFGGAKLPVVVGSSHWNSAVANERCRSNVFT